ncbi:hypothetical protein BDY17DRAFT_289421 [Neohortaea acidophila]|uniref:Integral membrane protein n=1 Tax=Neohortaea acidophila TaxID=245834 RepID=A0A6A6Q6R2_9PEZI|nr:uncharacterized protein BDY17DRAFT_289421 [Neohortaea acidophila]KAF2487674.1 hypothetical protein BDY17DRAFT_289421 [Neohortaea acidophila]
MSTASPTPGLARNQTFRPEREPFRYTNTLQLDNNKISGPFSFLNPTSAHFHPAKLDKASSASQTPSEEEDEAGQSKSSHKRSGHEVPASNVAFKWTSRNNRKGRHALVYQPPKEGEEAKYLLPPPTSSFNEIMKGLWRMLTYYPIWDVSFNVAYVFTWGSIVWVINAFFDLLPYTNPSTNFPGETLDGGGISAFIGATIFEFGSVLLMFEAVNENRSGCFGYALEQLYEEHVSHGGSAATTRLVASKDVCTHHHQNTKNFVGSPRHDSVATASNAAGVDDIDPTPKGAKSWVWWPSWYELRTHYFHDLGFIACSSQMFGATVFWISGFTALPGIYNHLNTPGLLNGAYWVPQVIGGMGFVISGTLFMLETQKHWWLPAPKVLGWHIGAWNLIGGIGFTLSPIFGLYGPATWAEEQAAVSTFWGSWAFLIGSVIQWYESLDKHPVEQMEKEDQHQ